jgi:hypothetical protein
MTICLVTGVFIVILNSNLDRNLQKFSILASHIPFGEEGGEGETRHLNFFLPNLCRVIFNILGPSCLQIKALYSMQFRCKKEAIKISLPMQF